VGREEAPGHIQPLKLVLKGEKANCERFDIMLCNFIAAAVHRPGDMLTPPTGVISSSRNCISVMICAFHYVECNFFIFL